jgi:hypothetical protein
MTRSIRFRAYSKRDKEMLSCEQIRPFDLWDLFDDKQWEVMQYTNVDDYDGKEMYDGDIIDCDNKVGIVEYDPQQSAYIILWQPHNAKQKSGCDSLSSTFPAIIKKVIGNIYENGELLCK